MDELKPLPMSEADRAEFEAFVKAELGDIAVFDNGRYISPKIANYWKLWQHRSALVGELQRDAERLNWMEKRLRGASDSERYLPFRVYWGDGRGIRKAIDAARGEKGGV